MQNRIGHLLVGAAMGALVSVGLAAIGFTGFLSIPIVGANALRQAPSANTNAAQPNVRDAPNMPVRRPVAVVATMEEAR